MANTKPKVLTYKQALELAKKAGSKYPNVVAAQFALETDWGRKTANAKNNLFNIKWNDRAANKLLKRGINVKRSAKSAKDNQTGSIDYYMEFDSIEDAFKGYQNFIETNPRYKDALKAKNEKEYLRSLKKAGYAEDPDYINSISNIVKTSTGKDLINIEAIKPKSKELKKLTDAESYSAYSKFKKEVAEEDKKLKEKGKDYQSTHTQNVREIYKEYQNKYGPENLKKGAQLVSEENKYVFENDNYEFKRIKEADNKISKITKKYPNGKISDSDLEEIENLKKQKKAYYAKLRIKADEKKLVQMKKDMQKMDVNSNEYKLAVKSYDEIEKFKNNLKSNITNKSVISKKKYNDFESQKEEDIYGYNKDVSIYEGNYDPSDISDLYQVEEFKPLNFDEDNENNGGSDNDYIDYTPDKNTNNTKKDNSDYNFDFFEGEPERASVYQDGIDNEKEQSVGGYLKENPTAVLSAALGVKGLIDSQTELPDIDVKDQTALSDSFYEYLNNLETISKQGFTPEEEANYLKQINDGYMASVDLAVQASGGNRAKVLAQSGKLNANKNDALLSFASQDAQLQRQNLEKYGQALQYKEAFNERKDTRMQSNEYNRQRAEFERASSKRQGGAALAAGSIQSLVNSIRDYKETGEGSVLDTYRKYMANKIKSEGIKINPNTGKPFQNAEEESNYYASQKDLNFKLKKASLDFGLKFNSNSNLTKPEKDYIYKRTNLLKGQDKLDFFKNYDLKTGVDGLKRILDPVEKSSLKDEMDFSSLEKPITEDLAKENIYNDFT